MDEAADKQQEIDDLKQEAADMTTDLQDELAKAQQEVADMRLEVDYRGTATSIKDAFHITGFRYHNEYVLR